MKLTDGLYLVGSGDFGLSDEYDCHVYLLDGGTEAALVDAGGGRDVTAIVDNIRSEGVPLDRVRYLILTHGHADHSAGAAELRETLGLAVFAAHDIADAVRRGDEARISLDVARRAGVYPPDFSYHACPVDGELVDGQHIVVGDCRLLVLETPGHAVGSMCFSTGHQGKQMLFSGDTVFFGGRILLQNIWDCDLQAQIRSIERLSTLHTDALLPGHRSFALRDGQRHIEAAIAASRKLLVPHNLIDP